MKPAAILALAVAFSLAAIASTAKTVTLPAQNANERSVNAVAGPPPAKKVATADDRSAHPSKKALKKSKVTPPPPLHDPN
jgi:hypothetical protein